MDNLGSLGTGNLNVKVPRPSTLLKISIQVERKSDVSTYPKINIDVNDAARTAADAPFSSSTRRLMNEIS